MSVMHCKGAVRLILLHSSDAKGALVPVLINQQLDYCSCRLQARFVFMNVCVSVCLGMCVRHLLCGRRTPEAVYTHTHIDGVRCLFMAS